MRRSFCDAERDCPFSQLGPRGSLIVNVAICVMLTGTRSGGARWWRDFNEHRGLVGHHAWQESVSFMWQKGTDHVRSFVSLSTISKVMGCSMGVCPGTPKALRRRFTWSPGVSAMPFEMARRVWPGARQPCGYDLTRMPLKAYFASRPFQRSW